ncbi:hypothetical protein WDU94_000696 [Cyamophila willieti]
MLPQSVNPGTCQSDSAHLSEVHKLRIILLVHRRRVCSPKVSTQEPVKVTVPTYQKFTKKCYENQICKGVRLTYETKYECCPGWAQNSKLSHGCNQPVCSRRCENGGKCVAPETCTCSPGFTGSYCEADLNECEIYQPCSHDCINVHGSYQCRCPSSYQLSDNKRNCIKGKIVLYVFSLCYYFTNRSSLQHCRIF